jgi:hypothetical protein
MVAMQLKRQCNSTNINTTNSKNMSILISLTKKILKKSFTRFMDRVGSKVVSGMADTSSDAPNSFHKPKRQVYKDYVQDPKNST